MKTRALLVAAMLAPAAYGQSPPTLKNLEPPVLEVYTPIKVRPEKVKPFTDRAVELNKQRSVLEEEGKKLSEKSQPASIEDHNRRVDAWKGEAETFRRETAAESRIRRNQAGFVAKSLGSWQDAIDDAADTLNAPSTPPVAPAPNTAPTTPTPAPVAAKPAATPAQPAATGPKPSSVPGLPPGMEPGKKATKPELPPGMTKGGK